MAPDTRERILIAAVACVGRTGFARTSLDAIAEEAGVGRATVYRYFPDGKDQLFDETIAWEVARFFTGLAAFVEAASGVAGRLEIGLPYAHRALAEHEVFQKVLETEPERLLPHLSTSIPLITEALRVYLTPLLEAEELAPGTDVAEAADYLARMILTFIRGQGTWDLGDPVQVTALVRGHLLAGILADPRAE
ncbi:MAG TPA: TetR/AcrR family transcriptional regulator [Acidimicrobiales bacterium]|nr:TetR/AcrR family transcriptional regulator [Acidimicrobiales bacterium]